VDEARIVRLGAVIEVSVNANAMTAAAPWSCAEAS
jgi:hypothetical protein